MSTEASLVGFEKVSRDVWVRPAQSILANVINGGPTAIILYAWGNADPKHIAKYVEGYRQLFPAARVVVVFSSIVKVPGQGLEQRARNMIPVIEAALGSSNITNNLASPDSERLLIHAMSGMGSISFASTLHAYHQRMSQALRNIRGLQNGQPPPLPHSLLVLDSGPGSTSFRVNAWVWSKGMAIAIGSFFPWPFIVTQALSAIVLAVIHLFAGIVHGTPAGRFSSAAINDTQLANVSARRLYLYSKTDEIVSWMDVESHAADARSRHYEIEMKQFEGTPHVGHMRVYPQQYWGAILNSWGKATSHLDVAEERHSVRAAPY